MGIKSHKHHRYVGKAHRVDDAVRFKKLLDDKQWELYDQELERELQALDAEIELRTRIENERDEDENDYLLDDDFRPIDFNE